MKTTKDAPKTIKIRIAVAVDSTGAWSASGDNTSRDAASMETVLDHELTGAVQSYFITVEIPLPRPVELTAAVELQEAA